MNDEKITKQTENGESNSRPNNTTSAVKKARNAPSPACTGTAVKKAYIAVHVAMPNSSAQTRNSTRTADGPAFLTPLTPNASTSTKT